jgi:two-component system, OmpR family, response regulator
MDSISRVAVVEDDPEISRMMTECMTDHGFEVAAARSGSDLDRVMSGGKIDCVILDVGLPGEDGLSICRRLRGKSSVPIIIVTGRDSDTDRVWSSAPMTTYLSPLTHGNSSPECAR